MSAPEKDFEKQDLRYSVLLKIWLGLIICLLVVAGVSVFTLRALKKKSLTIESGPTLESDIHQLPPKPRLQTDSLEDLRQLHEREDALLLHYGWVDQSKGRVRIPIDRAMALLVERGLPSRKAMIEKLSSAPYEK